MSAAVCTIRLKKSRIWKALDSARPPSAAGMLRSRPTHSRQVPSTSRQPMESSRKLSHTCSAPRLLAATCAASRRPALSLRKRGCAPYAWMTAMPDSVSDTCATTRDCVVPASSFSTREVAMYWRKK
jgi:hypothetical protein